MNEASLLSFSGLHAKGLAVMWHVSDFFLFLCFWLLLFWFVLKRVYLCFSVVSGIANVLT